MVAAGKPKKVSKKIVAPVFSFARRKIGPQGIEYAYDARVGTAKLIVIIEA